MKANFFPVGYSVPVNFKSFRYEELKEYFRKIYSDMECTRVLLAYEGDNWGIPHLCGKRLAYLNMLEKGIEITWDQVCKS